MYDEEFIGDLNELLGEYPVNISDHMYLCLVKCNFRTLCMKRLC